MSKKKYFLLFLAVFLSFRGGSFLGGELLDAYYSYRTIVDDRIIFSFSGGSFLGGLLLDAYYSNRTENDTGNASKILVNGDVEAYRASQKVTRQRPEEFLFYSMVMAKQHGYEPAGEDVCNIINEWYDSHPALGPKGKRAQFLLEEFGHQKASQQD